ncbi:hypothetical protein SKAU_G00142800 [Synaphobranchus kaupii]|uniref:Uncharacterized protein n=1 Tax=Synaphobranchus kaupii TaxID=118154 RepID=A0A9Q1J3G6_SYNKA|nr:hypothetical protein SKAU_G00142800 [Synaphobranchus kaupii]
MGDQALYRLNNTSAPGERRALALHTWLPRHLSSLEVLKGLKQPLTSAWSPGAKGQRRDHITIWKVN